MNIKEGGGVSNAHKKKNKCDCCWCDECVNELIEIWTAPVQGWSDDMGKSINVVKSVKNR